MLYPILKSILVVLYSWKYIDKRNKIAKSYFSSLIYKYSL